MDSIRRWKANNIGVCAFALSLAILLHCNVHAFHQDPVHSRRPQQRHQVQRSTVLKVVLNLVDVPRVDQYVPKHGLLSSNPVGFDTNVSPISDQMLVSSLFSTMFWNPSPIEMKKTEVLLERLVKMTPAEIDNITPEQQREIYNMSPGFFDHMPHHGVLNPTDAQIRDLDRYLRSLPWPKNEHSRKPHSYDKSVLALASGKSIRPSSNSQSKLGIEPHDNTAREMFPQASETLQAKVEKSLDEKFIILDANTILRGGDFNLPGFKPTRTILAPHSPEAVMSDSPTQFYARMKGAELLLPLIDKLPRLAFYYALVEFFVLRPNLDLYKEEVEDDPEGVAAETISDFAVRFGILFLLAVGTVAFT